MACVGPACTCEICQHRKASAKWKPRSINADLQVSPRCTVGSWNLRLRKSPPLEPLEIKAGAVEERQFVDFPWEYILGSFPPSRSCPPRRLVWVR